MALEFGMELLPIRYEYICLWNEVTENGCPIAQFLRLEDATEFLAGPSAPESAELKGVFQSD